MDNGWERGKGEVQIYPTVPGPDLRHSPPALAINLSLIYSLPPSSSIVLLIVSISRRSETAKIAYPTQPDHAPGMRVCHKEQQ
jgi:hypothetical protein